MVMEFCGLRVKIAVLLPVFGSGCVAVTVAVLVYLSLQLTVAVMDNVALAWFARLPIVQTPVPDV